MHHGPAVQLEFLSRKDNSAVSELSACYTGISPALEPEQLAPVVPITQEDRRRFLLNYVQKVDPQIMEQFADHAPNQVRLQEHPARRVLPNGRKRMFQLTSKALSSS